MFNTALATKSQPSHNKPVCITLRLGRPWTILITAGSSNICPLPNPRLCPLPRPHWPVGVQGRYRGLCMGGEGELWRDGGLGSGGVGEGCGGGSSNWRRPQLELSEVSRASRSMTGRQKQYVDTNLGKRISQLQLVRVTFTLHSSKWTKQSGQKQFAQNKHVDDSSGCNWLPCGVRVWFHDDF